MKKYTIKALMKSAAKCDLDAQHSLGAHYAMGDGGVSKDEAEAVKWYTKAAEQGHALSQYDLGFMLILGEGIEKDISTGMNWMEKAASKGSPSAARLLKDIYRDGLFEIEPDPGAALRWELIEQKLSNNC